MSVGFKISWCILESAKYVRKIIFLPHFVSSSDKCISIRCAIGVRLEVNGPFTTTTDWQANLLQSLLSDESKEKSIEKMKVRLMLIQIPLKGTWRHPKGCCRVGVGSVMIKSLSAFKSPVVERRWICKRKRRFWKRREVGWIVAMLILSVALPFMADRKPVKPVPLKIEKFGEVTTRTPLRPLALAAKRCE